MSPLVTACPGCGTAFRVGQEQLDAADGLVRCGACDAVFDARAHSMETVAPLPETATRSVDEEYIEGLLLGEAPSQPEPVNAAQAQPADSDAAPVSTSPQNTPASAMPRIPVEMPLERRMDAVVRRRVVAWMTGIVVAATLIGMQQLWLGRERHAQEPQLRPRYERLCELLGCELPPFRDLRLIRSTELLVRPDPARPGTLLIDASIVNKAPFAQAFPGIRIDFSDIQGAPVTSRVFAPREYLGAAELREGRMQPGDLLRIHIEMPDPGEHATNYELRLAEPSPR